MWFEEFFLQIKVLEKSCVVIRFNINFVNANLVSNIPRLHYLIDGGFDNLVHFIFGVSMWVRLGNDQSQYKEDPISYQFQRGTFSFLQDTIYKLYLILKGYLFHQVL